MKPNTEEKKYCVIAWVSDDSGGYQWYRQEEAVEALEHIHESGEMKGCRFLCFEIYAPKNSPVDQVRKAICNIILDIPTEQYVDIETLITID